MSVDPHEAERELRDEPPTAGHTIVGDPQHPGEIAPECSREVVRKARIEGATEGDRK